MPDDAAARESWEYLPDYASETLPRYTSYPPANRFSAAIADMDARAALAALDPSEAVSLYVHVPFCRKLCWYCGCHTSVPTRADPVGSYVEALIREAELVGAALGRRARISRLHFGGGSPDSLSAAQIEAVFNGIRSGFDFDPDAEIAAELDPRGVTPAIASAFVREGLNRASLGIQDVNPHVQALINRIQPAGVLERAVALLRDCGLDRINMDLMYGLPGQSVTDVERTADFAIRNGADRVAVFGYAHLPWFKKHQKAIRPAQLPGPEERLRQAEAAGRCFLEAGFVPIGFDHYARPDDDMAEAARNGSLRRNFQGYTTDCARSLIGLGASSISSLPGLFYQNTPDSRAYRNIIAAQGLPVVRGARVSDEESRTGALIERILCDFRAGIPETLSPGARERLGRLVTDALVHVGGGELVVTERGRPYVRNIAATFDPAFTAGGARHSLAI